MASVVWGKLPDEITLHITAKLFPRRSLVRLRALWKARNEMTSSYAATQRIYIPNISLPHSGAFLFQFDSFDCSKTESWVMEGSSGEYYKVGVNPHRIEVACNTMFCLRLYRRFCLCDEQSRSIDLLVDASHMFFGQAFDCCVNRFIMVMGNVPYDEIEVYESSPHYPWSTTRRSTYSGTVEFCVSGRGVYHKGKFYWVYSNNINATVIELNLGDNRRNSFPFPPDAIHTHSHGTAANYYLGGSDVGDLILVEKESGFMWKLENADQERWFRVDIRLPKNISTIAVNKSGWVMVVAEEINIYDRNLRLVRKVAIDEAHSELGMKIEEMKKIQHSVVSMNPPLLPFDSSYVWWPGYQNLSIKICSEEENDG